MLTVYVTQKHVQMALLKLWLGMLLLISAQSLTVQAQYRSPPEVVIPLRVTDPSRGKNPPGWLYYSLYFEGQRHFISMKPTKYLVSHYLSVFTYEHGVLVEDQPYIQEDCYFQGHIDEDPESMVAITSCLEGFWGTLEIKNTVYEIIPKRFSSTFEHLLYREDTEDPQLSSMRCALTDEEIAQQIKLQGIGNSVLMQSAYADWWTHKYTMELALVIDNKRYLHRNSNVTWVTDEVLTAVNQIDWYYIPVDIDVILTGLEIWTEEDQVNVDETILKVLPQFCQWKRTNVGNRIKHDVIHLWAKQTYGMYLGLAFVSSICSPTNCGVDSFMWDSLNNVAFTTAHELGHNLGMGHDEGTCSCGFKQRCIMAPSKGAASKFSNCSYSQMFNVITRRDCLVDRPDIEEPPTLSVCGNSVVEAGEQCDCGTVESCSNDTCCEDGCVLKKAATCAFGLCCRQCIFLPSGTLCRKENNECDLPEWCNGTSHMCPEDVYLEDGTPCKNSDGYCYEGKCNTHKRQCQQIFGNKSQSANQICYNQMNTRGDRFGNCGNQSSNKRYLRCQMPDVLCGRLHCENVEGIPTMMDHSALHWTRFNESTCWSIDYHFGMEIPDVGQVKEGTECGPEHLCYEKRCVNKSFLLSDCSRNITCHEKGVCNNKHHCHCDMDWDPPYCLERGMGGSLDSGPPPRKGRANNYMLYFIPFYFIPFLVLLCLLIAFIMKKKSNKTQPEAPSETLE